MPQASNVYACARISALQKNVIDYQTILRMCDSSLEDIYHILQEMHYGFSTETSENDCEEMIERVRVETAKEIRELSTMPEITDLFLMETDVRNLKVLIKSFILGEEAAKLQQGGIYENTKMQIAAASGDYSFLPAVLRIAASQLSGISKSDTDPQAISIELDKAYYRYALETASRNKCDFAQQYFEALCDFGNVITLFRIKAFGGGKDRFDSALLPSGEISRSALLSAFDSGADSYQHLFGGCRCTAFLAEAIAEYMNKGTISSIEKFRDNYLLGLVKSHKHEVFTMYPVLGYYFARDREAKAIRLITTVKRNKLDNGIIGERLCELYG